MKHNQPLTDAQRAIVEDNLHLINYALAKVPVYLFDSREDAFQTGVIGLIKAARSFDTSRNVLFSTYASRCIINELLMAVRRILRTQSNMRTYSIDAPIQSADGECVTLADQLPSEEPRPDERFIARDSLEGIMRTLRAMPDGDALRIIRMALRQTKQADMAVQLGCTQSCVSRKLRRIRAVLQNSME